MTAVINVFLSTEASLLKQIVLIAIAGIACAVVGGLVYRHNKPKQYEPPKFTTKARSKQMKIVNGIFLCLEVFEVFALIPFPFLTWQIYFVNGVPVVTYANIFVGLMFLAGLFMLRDLVRKVRAYRKEKDIDVLLSGFFE